MNIPKETICDINLYKFKLEGMVKIVFWIASWVVGIAVMMNTADKRTLASAYLIFSLSLLMEFAPGINKKTHLLGTIVHGAFCFILILILLISVAALAWNGKSDTVSIPDVLSYIMFGLSIAVIIFMFLNLLSIIVFADVKPDAPSNITISKSNSDTLQEIYANKLSGGPLGNLNEGDKHYE